MCSVEISELGSIFRRQRTAAGRTIASVAAEAGLSVPYIANLENGRGNPTLSAVSNLAAALGSRLVVRLADDDPPAARLPGSLVQFSRGARFRAEVARLGDPEIARLLAAMAAVGALTERPLTELDWHRVLDTVVLLTRPVTPAE